MTAQSPKQWQQTYCNASVIVRCQHTRVLWRQSTFGEVLVYQDDKIEIKANGYNPALWVILGLSGAMVLSIGSHYEAYVYRPGAWEKYLAALAVEARRQQSEKLTAQRRGIPINHEALRFTPVDDDAFFQEGIA